MHARYLSTAAVFLAAATLPAAAPEATAADQTSEVLRQQQNTVEDNRRKLDQSIQKNQIDREQTMNRELRRQQRDAVKSERAR